MKPADIEWGMLRGALIGLAIAAAVAGALVGSSYHFWESKDLALKSADRDRRAAELEYRKLDELEQMVITYYPMFQELERLGIIGEERRLNWTEALRDADAVFKLPSLTYSVSTQEPYQDQAEFPLVEGAYKLYASEMNLQMGLLHGEDFFRVLGKLEEDADGLFSVDSCRIERRRDTPGGWEETHLASECRLRWYTIQKPTEVGS